MSRFSIGIAPFYSDFNATSCNNDTFNVYYSSYYGHLSSLRDISTKIFKKLPQGKKKHVHLIPVPKNDPNEDDAEDESHEGKF